MSPVTHADADCPTTQRSPGNDASAAPPPQAAWGKYQVIAPGTVIVDVMYVGRPDLFSLSRLRLENPDVTARDVDPVYEAAYMAAARAAGRHGFRLERFARRTAAPTTAASS